MMETAAPPTYEEALGIIKKLVDNPPSPANVAKAHKAMALKAASPETSQALKQEVKKLAGAVIQIDQSFEKVRLSLLQVDRNNYKNADGSPVKKLAPGWVVLQQRYTAILLASRLTATNTKAHIDDFVKVIIPMLDEPESVISFKDKLAELEAFIKKQREGGVNIGDAAGDAVKLSEEFRSLRDAIEAYGIQFEKFAEDQHIEYASNIKELKEKLIGLEKEIKDQEDAIFKAGLAMGATAFGVGLNAIGAIVALGPAGPLVAVGIIIAGLIALGTEAADLATYVKKKNDARAEWDSTYRELQDTKAKLEELVQLRAILDTCKLEINTIVARLDQFGIVWSLIASDATIIANDLKTAHKVRTDEGFREKVELMRVSYTALGDALAYYATITELPTDT